MLYASHRSNLHNKSERCNKLFLKRLTGEWMSIKRLPRHQETGTVICRCRVSWAWAASVSLEGCQWLWFLCQSNVTRLSHKVLNHSSGASDAVAWCCRCMTDLFKWMDWANVNRWWLNIHWPFTEILRSFTWAKVTTLQYKNTPLQRYYNSSIQNWPCLKYQEFYVSYCINVIEILLLLYSFVSSIWMLSRRSWF